MMNFPSRRYFLVSAYNKQRGQHRLAALNNWGVVNSISVILLWIVLLVVGVVLGTRGLGGVSTLLILIAVTGGIAVHLMAPLILNFVEEQEDSGVVGFRANTEITEFAEDWQRHISSLPAKARDEERRSRWTVLRSIRSLRISEQNKVMAEHRERWKNK
jgi:hypothetical protein